MLSEVQKLLATRIGDSDQRLKNLNDCKANLEYDIRYKTREKKKIWTNFRDIPLPVTITHF